MATVFRGPLVTRVGGPSAQTAINAEGWVWTNRLLDLLASTDVFFDGPGNAPTYDWPNPRGAVPSVELRTFLNAIEIQLIGKDTFFGAAGQPPTYDWPNPRGAVPSVELLTFLNAVALQLIGLDQFFNAPGQGPTYDWPNPRGPVGTIELRSWLFTLPQATLVLVPPAPALFGQELM